MRYVFFLACAQVSLASAVTLEIVVPSRPLKTVELAADELADHVEKSVGVRPKIRSEDQATLVPMQDAKATWTAVKPGYIEMPVCEKPRTYPFAKPQKLLKRLGIESKDVIAGSRVKFAYVFEGKAPDFGFKGQINIAKGRPVVWSDPLEFTPEKNVVDFGDGTWQLSFEYAFPSCFNDGDYGWGWRSGASAGAPDTRGTPPIRIRAAPSV